MYVAFEISIPHSSQPDLEDYVKKMSLRKESERQDFCGHSKAVSVMRISHAQSRLRYVYYKREAIS